MLRDRMRTLMDNVKDNIDERREKSAKPMARPSVPKPRPGAGGEVDTSIFNGIDAAPRLPRNFKPSRRYADVEFAEENSAEPPENHAASDTDTGDSERLWTNGERGVENVVENDLPDPEDGQSNPAEPEEPMAETGQETGNAGPPDPTETEGEAPDDEPAPPADDMTAETAGAAPPAESTPAATEPAAAETPEAAAAQPTAAAAPPEPSPAAAEEVDAPTVASVLDDNDLDAEIARLLKQDEEETLEALDDDGLVKDVAVFDRDRPTFEEMQEQHKADEQAAAVPEENGKGLKLPKFLKLSTIPTHQKYVYAASLLGILLMLTVGVGVFLRLRYPMTPAASDAVPAVPSMRVDLQTPQNAINSASFIYLDLPQQVGLTLNKMAYGQLSTDFYFAGTLDRQKYGFTLQDGSGAFYPQDRMLTPARNEVSFRPFTEDVDAFSLTVHNNATNESFVYKFKVDKPKMMPARWLNAPFDVYPDSPGILFIENGVFSNTGSQLQLRYMPNGAQDSFTLTDDVTFSLQNGAQKIMPQAPADGLYPGYTAPADGAAAGLAYVNFPDENILLARLAFGPVDSLSDRVTLAIKNLSHVYAPEAQLDTAPLFNFAETGTQDFPLDDITLVLEGMQMQGDSVVLVLHGVDNGRRVKVDVDAELVIKDGLGASTTVAGEYWSGDQGTDVVFKVPWQSQVDGDNSVLLLHRVTTALPEMDVQIDLTRLSGAPDKDHEEAVRQLEGLTGGQSDLMYIEGNMMLGAMVETTEYGAAELHTIKAAINGGQWGIMSDEITRP